MNLKDKTIIVTGAGSGIGKELTMALIGRGAKVVAVDLRQEGLTKLVEDAGDKSQSITTHVLDISDKAAVEALPEKIKAENISIDGIINNAGIIQPFVKVNDLPYEAIEKVMNVNFFGTLYMTKTFLPILLERPEAYIVNVSSMGGFLPVPGQSVYGASKAAVKLFTEGLFAELLDTKVHVSAVFPGATNTNIAQNSGAHFPTHTDADMKKNATPMLEAHVTAEIIVSGMEKNQPQIFTGNDSKFMSFLYRLNPVYATKFITKQMSSLLGK